MSFHGIGSCLMSIHGIGSCLSNVSMGLGVVCLWDWEFSIHGIGSCLSMGLGVV